MDRAPEPVLQELAFQRASGGDHQRAAVVEERQIAPEQAFDHRVIEPKVAEIFGQETVVAAHQGAAQELGARHGLPTDREDGVQVDDVRPKTPELREGARDRREARLDVPEAGQGERWEREYQDAWVQLALRPALALDPAHVHGEHGDRMPAAHQLVGGGHDRAHDTVDLREEGIGEEGDAHVSSSAMDQAVPASRPACSAWQAR